MVEPAGHGPRRILETSDLSLIAETWGNILLVRVSGRLDGVTADSFKKALESAPLGDHQTCLLDMTGVNFVASEGLRALLLYRQSLSNSSCKLSLCSLTESVQTVFHISGFAGIFSIYPDQDAAWADN